MFTVKFFSQATSFLQERPWLVVPTLGLIGCLIFACLIGDDRVPVKDSAHPNKTISKRLIYRPCDYLSTGLLVKCFYYRTHDKNGFYLPLALIQQPSAGKVERDLLIQIPGGPGQGFMTTADEIDFWAEQVRSNKWDFDILLYDPRGTGEGKHAWRCEALQRKTEEVLASNITLEDEYKTMFATLSRCKRSFVKHLRSSNIGVSQDNFLADTFSALKQREDLQGMVKALEYKRVHLFGSSYGTRVALLAADIPQVASLILDAAYGFDQGLASREAQLLDRAYAFHQVLYRQWGEGPLSFDALYNSISTRLKENALEMELEHFTTGEKLSFVLTADRFLDLMFGTLYRSETLAAFYSGAVEFNRSGEVSDDFRYVVESYISNVHDKNFSSMVFFASECADNIEEDDELLRKRYAEYPLFYQYLSPAIAYNACEIFISSLSDAVQTRYYFNKPTLIFSGQYDPITPSSLAQQLADKLPSARHIEVKNAGHGVLFTGLCDLSFLSRFTRSTDLSTEITCEDGRLWQ